MAADDVREELVGTLGDLLTGEGAEQVADALLPVVERLVREAKAGALRDAAEGRMGDCPDLVTGPAPASDRGDNTARPLPTIDTVTATCDWGNCNGETVALRWNDTGEGISAWLSVCPKHRTKASEPLSDVVPAAARPTAEERCPEHGSLCNGAACCCADKHPAAVRDDVVSGVTEALERDRLREAVARALMDADGGDGWWDRAYTDERKPYIAQADAVLALPEMPALLDTAEKVRRVEALVDGWRRYAEPPSSMVSQIRAALRGES